MKFLNLTGVSTHFSWDAIFVYDYILLPLYIFILLFLTKIIIDVYFKNALEKRYIYLSLFLKIAGGIFISMVYNYYYHGGDTIEYFNEGKILSNIIFENPEAIFRVLFYNPKGGDGELDLMIKHLTYVAAPDTLIILKITAIINLFSFNSFLITTLFYSYISFWCIWRFAMLLFRLYPSNKFEIILAFFYTPSLVVWGSGLLKDTVCFSCLCILHYYLYNIFIFRKTKISYFIYILIAGYLLVTIKIYILLAYLPCFVFMLSQHYKNKIRIIPIRVLVSPFIIITGIVISYFLINKIGESNKRYTTSNLIETATVQRTYLHSVSIKSNGSAYEMDLQNESMFSYIINIPNAINVTLFRPYLWESKNAIMLLSSFESLFVLYITLRLFYKQKYKLILKKLYSDPNLQFFLIFSIFFSYFVGLTSSNFGSLVRYKIQGLPFYILLILLLNYRNEKKNPKNIRSK
jgi:hypothetical protein